MLTSAIDTLKYILVKDDVKLQQISELEKIVNDAIDKIQDIIEIKQ
ncbi:MAG: hypothetical protein LBU35_03770 [Holosporales bacterium]|nr:hypothetical protein [Holosporales bacterium]